MNAFTGLDIAAVVWFTACWIGYSMFADVMTRRSDNLITVMDEYRRNWMRQMLARDNRMVDAALIGNLLRSISFFASTSIFIVLGLFTLLKYREEASDIITVIPYASPTSPLLWETKIFLLVIIFVYTFFKYTWSLRQYNYACILVGAAPPSGERNTHYEEYAQNAARLVGNAARHFNMALRAYYFGLAAIGWFINPALFILASTWVVLVIYRREYRSHALHYLISPAIFQSDE
jgi:uncharacterized membrane protein